MAKRSSFNLCRSRAGTGEWRRSAALVSALAVALVLSACGSRGDSNSAASSTDPPTASAPSDVPNADAAAPEAGPSPEGGQSTVPGAGEGEAPAASPQGNGPSSVGAPGAPSTPAGGQPGRGASSGGAAGRTAPAPTPGRPGAPTPGGPSGAPTPGPGATPAPGGPGSNGGATDVGITPDTITIGGVVDASSALSGLQAPFRTAWDGLVNYFNSRGGINGRKLQMVWVETGGDPSRNSAGVRKLVEQSKVWMITSMDIVGNGGSSAYLKEKNVPVVGGDSTGNFWFQYPNYYPTGSQYAGPAAMGEWAVQQKRGSKYALLYCNLQQCTEGAAVMKDRIQRRGGKVVYEALIPVGTPDMTVYTSQAQAAGADAVMTAWETGSNIALLKTLERQQWYPYVSLVTSGQDEQMFHGGLSEKILSATETNMQFPWYTDQRIPTFSIYRDAMKLTYGDRDTLEGVASMKAFASYLILTKALGALGPNLTRQRLMDYLNTQGGGDLAFGGAVPPDTDYRPGKNGEHRESQCTVEAKLDGKTRDFPTTSPGWLCVTKDGIETRPFQVKTSSPSWLGASPTRFAGVGGLGQPVGDRPRRDGMAFPAGPSCPATQRRVVWSAAL